MLVAPHVGGYIHAIADGSLDDVPARSGRAFVVDHVDDGALAREDGRQFCFAPFQFDDVSRRGIGRGLFFLVRYVDEGALLLAARDLGG